MTPLYPPRAANPPIMQARCRRPPLYLQIRVSENGASSLPRDLLSNGIALQPFSSHESVQQMPYHIASVGALENVKGVYVVVQTAVESLLVHELLLARQLRAPRYPVVDDVSARVPASDDRHCACGPRRETAGVSRVEALDEAPVDLPDQVRRASPVLSRLELRFHIGVLGTKPTCPVDIILQNILSSLNAPGRYVASGGSSADLSECLRDSSENRKYIRNVHQPEQQRLPQRRTGPGGLPLGQRRERRGPSQGHRGPAGGRPRGLRVRPGLQNPDWSAWDEKGGDGDGRATNGEEASRRLAGAVVLLRSALDAIAVMDNDIRPESERVAAPRVSFWTTDLCLPAARGSQVYLRTKASRKGDADPFYLDFDGLASFWTRYYPGPLEPQDSHPHRDFFLSVRTPQNKQGSSGPVLRDLLLPALSVAQGLVLVYAGHFDVPQAEIPGFRDA